MKIQTLLEMPEIIPQQELIGNWMKQIDLSKTLWAVPLEGRRSDITLVCHPFRGGATKKAVMAYINKTTIIAGMMIGETPLGPNTFCEVYAVEVAPKARGSGIAQDMYITLAMVRNYVMVSDDVQTMGGSGIWKRLAAAYPGHVSVTDGDHIFDLDDWPNGDPFTDPDSRLLFYNIKPKDIPSL